MKASDHPLYQTWMGMRQRCNNSNHSAYGRYGGRGVRVCARWDDFWKFLSDVGEKPGPEFSLDRIDGKQGYQPGNVRWATATEQKINQKLRSDNKSGCKGVKWFHRTSRWMVYINFRNRRYALGYYEDYLDACSVRKSAENHIWGVDAEGYFSNLKSYLATRPNSGRFRAKANEQQCKGVP